MRMLLRKDMAFLPLCKHVDTQICRVKRMLSHVPAHSLSFSLPFPHGHNHNRIHTGKKKGVWLCSFTLWQETLRQSQREERHSSYFLPQNLQHLPIKRETVQLDSIVDRQHGDPDSGTPNTSSAVDAAKIEYESHPVAATWIIMTQLSIYDRETIKSHLYVLKVSSIYQI